MLVSQSLLNKIKFIVRKGLYSCSKTKTNYKVLFNSFKNKPLFDLLYKVGFFDFHKSNKGSIISLHQIVAYVNKGYKAYQNGFLCLKGETEIHHIDSNPLNNKNSNLIYVSTQEHLLITQASNINSSQIHIVKKADPCAFNNKGLPVVNPFKRLAYIVSLTIRVSFKRLGIKIKIPYSSILAQIPNCYTLKRINWTPSFLTRINDAIFEFQCYDY